MADFNWTEYLILVGLAVLGALAVIPYAFTLNKDKLAQSPLSPRQLVLATVAQSVILFAVLTFVGMLAADAVGLSIGSAAEQLPLAVLLGVLGATILIALEHYAFQPRLPAALRDADKNIAWWKRLAASLYGGVNEEILARLFLVSGIAWLLGHVWETSAAVPTAGAFWAAIILAAVVFGLGHLPATAAITRLTPLIVGRALLLNGIVSLLFGWLFWQHGLVATMVAHFSADIVIHLAGPLLLRQTSPPPPTAAAQAA